MVCIINQPSEVRLGDKITETLSGDDFDSFYFIVAFAKKSGVSRIQDAMQTFVENGGNIEGVVGVDSKGTSVEGLTLLLELTNNLYIYHDEDGNHSFHPKIYIFEKAEVGAKIWIGSSNLTAGGLFTNYEIDVEFDFDFEEEKDIELFTQIKNCFDYYTDTECDCCKLLNAELLEQLIEDDRLIDIEARINSGSYDGGRGTTREIRVPFGRNPFSSAPPPFHDDVVDEDDDLPTAVESSEKYTISPTTHDAWEIKGELLWKKSNLPASDVLYDKPGTNVTGGLRLAKAGWKVDGETIDQTTYFRWNVFGKVEWVKKSTLSNVEVTEVLFNVKILEKNVGEYTLELRHNPDWEAGQNNYTTILSWGDLAPEIKREDLRKTDFYLYAPSHGQNEPFFIEIRNHSSFTDPFESFY